MFDTELWKEASACYPSEADVDRWCRDIRERTDAVEVEGTLLSDSRVTESFGNGPNALVSQYVRFTANDGRRTFYGYWQPAYNTPAPLLINLPGYGGCINLHPQLNDLGFHILHISPLGYITPEGNRTELAGPDGQWPVLDHTARGLPGGYEDWLSDVLLGIRWALQQPGVEPRLSLYGTSQGGGGSLLTASILGPEQVRCVCADLPFLTDFPGAGLQGDAHGLLQAAYATEKHEDFWQRLGLVDTLSHAHRLRLPVMLSGGGADEVCPARCAEALFARLPATKQYTYLEQQVHTHSRASMYLFGSWLKMYG